MIVRSQLFVITNKMMQKCAVLTSPQELKRKSEIVITFQNYVIDVLKFKGSIFKILIGRIWFHILKEMSSVLKKLKLLYFLFSTVAWIGDYKKSNK